MPVRNPIDATDPEAESIREEIIAALLLLGSLLAVDEIIRAIRTGRSVPIFKSAPWTRFLENLRGIVPHISKAASRGIVRTRLIPRSQIAELAEEWAEIHAAELIRGLDLETRRNFRRMVRNASRRLANRPRAAVAAELAADIRRFIGLTSKQAQQVAREAFNLQRAGKSLEGVAQIRAARVSFLLDQRAAFLGREAAAVAFNEGTLRAGIRAQELGGVRLVMKRARTMEDERVRAQHTRVAALGPIALDALFPIFNAPRPPWPGEPGCRCWLEISGVGA